MRNGLIVLLTVLALSVGVDTALAQPKATVILKGRVLDKENGNPLVDAHVFIATSMIGTTTDSEGRYSLVHVPTGAHRLYVSMLGFEPDFKDIMLRASRAYTFNFELTPAILEAGEITVEAERDKDWMKRLERFTRMFIGESPNAAETKIINPEVLDFEEKRGTFYARAAEPLIIENLALGYRIKYFLKDFEQDRNRTRFDGEPLYEELEPKTPSQEVSWHENRVKAFTGSFRHFLLALLSQRTEGQGFKTYSRPDMNTLPGVSSRPRLSMSDRRFPLDPAKLIGPGASDTEFVMDFDGFVEIIYQGEEEDPTYYQWLKRFGRRGSTFQTSWIQLEHGAVVVDYKGDILDPYGVTFYGYLAFERVADEVPREYRPGPVN